MMSARRTLAGALALLLLLGGAAAIACARWLHPVAEADEALAAGDWERARLSYALAEARFDRLPAVRQLLARDYARVVGAQMWIAYHQQRYDEVIDKAQHAPAAAEPHLWSGLAFYAMSRGDGKPDQQFGWLSRAEEELRRAVEAAPADWDAKYDFELVTRLAAALRKSPKVPPNQLMQLLRPQQRPAAKSGRHIG
jgi:hypothetical protein